jgi:hypothetical protein
MKGFVRALVHGMPMTARDAVLVLWIVAGSVACGNPDAKVEQFHFMLRK